MNIIRVFLLLFLCSNVLCQDNPTSIMPLSGKLKCDESGLAKIRTRIFGGPTLSYVLSSNLGYSKGTMLGTNLGVEFNIRTDQRLYFILGLDLNSTNYQTWLNSNDGRFITDNFVTLDLPVGLGINCGKDIPKGLFINAALVNGVNLYSYSKEQRLALGNILTDLNERGKADIFNFGVKAEMGFKGLLHKKYYSSFSGVTKYMGMNFLDQNNRVWILNFALLGSLYF